MKTVWAEFKTHKQKKGKDREVSLLAQDISLEGKVVKIQLTNDVLRNVFDDMKAELLIHLRKTLQSNELKLELEAVENDDSKMIYTNKEKFDFLAEKHPELNYMKDQLGLDTDF